MANVINTNTNRQEIAITRNGEPVGSIYFNPSDIGIIKRLREVRERLNDFKVNTTDENDVDAMLAEADRVDKELRDAIDYAFGYACSDVVFGGGYSFETVNGESTVEQFLTAALDIISGEMEKEAKASRVRQAKYLDKYQGK